MPAEVSETSSDDSVSLLGAIAIGVGGMVGGGIFAVLGLASMLAGGATPIAFAVAGIVALLTAYSYARMSVAYPDNGGTIIFIDEAFGVGWMTGSINNLLWIGYIVTLALYAVAFGNYSTTFLPEHLQGTVTNHALICIGIGIPLLLNFLGASIVTKAETFVVAFKVAILVLVIAAGFGGIDSARLDPDTWAGPLQIAGAGMIIFVAYEGFELIANTAANVRDPEKTLPRAYFACVIFVIALYVLISAVVVGALPADQIATAKDFALAAAAEPSLGHIGFTIVGVAAVLATLSAINSTLYGAARLSFAIATEGELPQALEREAWDQPVGLIITGAASLILANVVDLSAISTMASATFLTLFALVSLACVVKSEKAHSSRLVAGSGVAACVLALVALVVHTYQTNASQLWYLAGVAALAVVGEGLYQAFLAEEGKRIRRT
jgi:amino acid transporter